MPIYEYQCSQCGKIAEYLQKFSDPPITVCSECGAEVKRLVSRTSFQLKGSGWYATDYKKASGPSPASASKLPETKASEATPKAITETSPSKDPGASDKS